MNTHFQLVNCIRVSLTLTCNCAIGSLCILHKYLCCHSDPKAVFEFGVRGHDRFLDGIQCIGNESNILLQCILDGFEEPDCFHHEAAGVSCGNSPSHSL